MATHARKECPGRTGDYCRTHKWPSNNATLERQAAAAADHPAGAQRETARRGYKTRDPGKRQVAVDRRLEQAARDGHRANAMGHELELLTATVQQVLDEARKQRGSKYDGRAVIEAGKRRRRELIVQAHRTGLNQL